MERTPYLPKKIYLLIATLIVCFGLVLQFYLVIRNVPQTGLTYTAEVVRFFSYMTVLSNILVACCFIFQLIATKTGPGKFFGRPSVQAAICLYIFIVGLLNHLLLSQLYDFEGPQWIADKLLHYIVPVLYIVYWAVFADKAHLIYPEIFKWLAFPLLYVVYAMIRGAITGLYPYPFLDAPVYGYRAIFLNMGFITAAYAAGASLLVFINNKLAR